MEPSDGAIGARHMIDLDVPSSDVPDQAPTSKRHLPVLPKKKMRDGRARTLSVKRLAKRDLERGMMEYPKAESDAYERPQTRADCLPGGCNAARPCPFVSCAYHLYLDVNEDNGAIKSNFPDLEVWQLRESCVLDVADRGGATLEMTGDVLNLTRERIRQVEKKVLANLRPLAKPLVEGFAELSPAEPAAPDQPVSLDHSVQKSVDREATLAFDYVVSALEHGTVMGCGLGFGGGGLGG